MEITVLIINGALYLFGLGLVMYGSFKKDAPTFEFTVIGLLIMILAKV
jgi:hypothetical protein